MITRDQVKAAAEALGFSPDEVSQLRITPTEVWAEVWDGNFPIVTEWHRCEVQL